MLMQPKLLEQEAHVLLTEISVRNIELQAKIGVLEGEVGQRQKLIVNVVLSVDLPVDDLLFDAVDYRVIVSAAERLADCSTGLIETFAERLARACLKYERVELADVRIEKPAALTNGVAGARVVLRRGN